MPSIVLALALLAFNPAAGLSDSKIVRAHGSAAAVVDEKGEVGLQDQRQVSGEDGSDTAVVVDEKGNVGMKETEGDEADEGDESNDESLAQEAQPDDEDEADEEGEEPQGDEEDVEGEGDAASDESLAQEAQPDDEDDADEEDKDEETEGDASDEEAPEDSLVDKDASTGCRRRRWGGICSSRRRWAHPRRRAPTTTKTTTTKALTPAEEAANHVNEARAAVKEAQLKACRAGVTRWSVWKCKHCENSHWTGSKCEAKIATTTTTTTQACRDSKVWPLDRRRRGYPDNFCQSYKFWCQWAKTSRRRDWAADLASGCKKTCGLC